MSPVLVNMYAVAQAERESRTTRGPRRHSCNLIRLICFVQLQTTVLDGLTSLLLYTQQPGPQRESIHTVISRVDALSIRSAYKYNLRSGSVPTKTPTRTGGKRGNNAIHLLFEHLKQLEIPTAVNAGAVMLRRLPKAPRLRKGGGPACAR